VSTGKQSGDCLPVDIAYRPRRLNLQHHYDSHTHHKPGSLPQHTTTATQLLPISHHKKNSFHSNNDRNCTYITNVPRYRTEQISLFIVRIT